MTQREQIRDRLLSGNSITAIEALKLYGCFRCAARIAELRDQGFNIKTETISLEGKRFAKYYLL